jgi:hypothetical protein
MLKRNLFLGMAALALLAPPSLAQMSKSKEVKFTVRIENTSSVEGQTASNGAKWPFALSPGLWVVHEREVRLFREGLPAANGLEAQAEDGNPGDLVKMLEARGHKGPDGEMLHGVFNIPVGSNGPGPIGPGGAYEFTFVAKPGMRLSVITMFGQSNDWFYAPSHRGVELFKNGKAISGDMTAEFMLYDAGTEVNEEPGIGPNQAPRQSAPNTGPTEKGKTHLAKESTFFNKTGQLFRVTITPDDSIAKM